MGVQEPLARVGRLSFPLALFAYPFYLWKRSPGKEGSHFDPACDLFVPSEKNMARPCRVSRLGSIAPMPRRPVYLPFARLIVCSQQPCAGRAMGECFFLHNYVGAVLARVAAVHGAKGGCIQACLWACLCIKKLLLKLCAATQGPGCSP